MPSASKLYAVPISSFQSGVLRLLARQRSPDSYVAGGIPINRAGPRFSADINLVHVSAARQASAVTEDESVLLAAGYTVMWPPGHRTGTRTATIAKGGDEMQLEWATDPAFRFFPTQPDELFGYVLHPVDLAANKASAAADRRVPRDIVDLLTLHEAVLPLGAIVAAAVGKFPGTTPEAMLAEITRQSRFTADEFQALATERPLDIPALHARIRGMIEAAGAFLAALPCDAVGYVFLDRTTPVQPDPARLDRYRRHAGSVGGIWPTSPDIERAMLDRPRPPPTPS